MVGGVLLVIIDYMINNNFCQFDNCAWYYGFIISGVVASALSFIAMKMSGFHSYTLKEEEMDEKLHQSTIFKILKVRFKESIIEPLRSLSKNKNFGMLLLFILIYKFCDAFIKSMVYPFFIDVGFSLTELGVIYKSVGFVSSFIGVMCGSFLTYKVGLIRSLFISGILQTAGNFLYIVQNYLGNDVIVLCITVSIEHVSGNMALAAFLAYMSSICDKKHAITQYALLSSIAMAISVVIAPVSGMCAEYMGWNNFFLLSIILGFPALYIMIRHHDVLQGAIKNGQ